MFSHKIVVTLALVAVLVFAGCQPAENAQQPVTLPDSTTGITTTTEVSETPEIPEIDETAVPALSETDQVAYTAAFQLNDPSYCDKIALPKVVQECKTALNNRATLKKAKQTGDPSLCAQLPTEDKVNACELELEVTAKIRAADVPPTEQDFQAFLEAKQNNNLQQCEKINNGDLKSSCRIQIEKATR